MSTPCLRRALSLACLLAIASWCLGLPAQALPSPEESHGQGIAQRGLWAPPNPILFVTQVPIPDDFATIGSTFANHLAGMSRVGRGGDLWIQYPNGTRRNLTAEAGYGAVASQRGDAIAARSPAVSWDGTRAVFSMVVGGPAEQYEYNDYYWQLYEVTGLALGQTAQITRVPHQPGSYNNISPIYASDGRILFSSDRPRNGRRHLYPQLDEYESTDTVTGLWSLDPVTGELELLDHAPSGSFTPIVDSFGRVIFTRWDHLQRDQQADADALGGGNVYGSFNYSDESASASLLPRQEEVFPEPRSSRTDLLAGTNLQGHRLNSFFPWQMTQDGRQLEFVNHVGRHELHGYFDRALNDDPNLEEFIAAGSGRTNPRSIENMFHLREDPTAPGRYVGTDAPEFQTHSGGQLIAFSAPPGLNPDAIVVDYLTHPDTRDVVADGGTAGPNHSGFYRNPLPLSDGSLLASHTFETRAANNDGTRANPMPRYHFRLRRLVPQGGYLAATTALTPGLSKAIDYWDPDVLVSYSGELWELDPVEVVARAVPTQPPVGVPEPEQGIFTQLGIDSDDMRSWLEARDLALVVVRNATTRDEADRQQPFNLAVPNGVSTVGASGTTYDISRFQFFQGDQLRGYGGTASPRTGRRVLATELHEPEALDHSGASAANPAGSVPIAGDGSVAAFVPAARALSWQTLAPSGEPVVRERFWLTFKAGEIRACDGCHGVNSRNQAGGVVATNPPQALADLLGDWLVHDKLVRESWETGVLKRWSKVVE
jgi:hypothetical protein